MEKMFENLDTGSNKPNNESLAEIVLKDQNQINENLDKNWEETKKIIGGAQDNENAVVITPKGADQIFQKPEKQDAGADVKDGSETKAETYEERMEKRREIIKNKAEERYQKRVTGEISEESQIEILHDNKINEDLESGEAKKFLENWDWSRAEEDVNKEYRVKISWLDKEDSGGKNGDKPKEKPKEGSGNEKREMINDAENKVGSSDGKAEATTEVDGRVLEKDKKTIEQRKEERYGSEQPKSSATWQFFKNILINPLGSALGVRAAWELYNFYSDPRYDKKILDNQKEGLGQITLDLLKESREMKAFKNEISEKEIEEEAKKVKQERLRPDNITSHEFVLDMLKAQKIVPDTDKSDKKIDEWDRKEATRRLKEEKGSDWKKITAKSKELNDKLKEVKMPPEEKRALRDQMAQVLLKCRHEEKRLSDEKIEKIGKLLDAHINNKAQKLLVKKELFNTATVFLGGPMLRVAGFGGFAAWERGRKVAERYDKQWGGKDESKWKAVLKGLTTDALEETGQGLLFGMGDKQKKGSVKRTLDFASSAGVALRFASMYWIGSGGYEEYLRTGNVALQEGTQKVIDAMKNFDIWTAGGQMGHNWVANADRFIGPVWNLINKHLPDSITGVGKGGFEDSLHRSDGKAAEEWGKHITEQYQKDYQNVTNVFGADSEISGKLLSGGLLDQQKIHLVETLKNIGLAPDDFKNFHGDGGQLGQLLDKVDKLGSEHQVDIMRVLIDNPSNVANLDNPVVQSILKSKLGGDHIKELLSAKQVAEINKPGGSISEVLYRAMGQNDKVTMVNPDGSILEKFDANLVHKGDAVSLSDKGEITVFKMSNVSVKAGQSLEKVYTDIAGKLDKAGVPKDIQDRLNEGVGHWGEKITRGESEKMLHFWNNHKTAYGHLTPEKQQEFLHNLHSAKSDAEVDKMLNEISNAPAHSVAEAVAPTTEAVAHPAENVAQGFDFGKELNLTQELKSESAYRALHNMRRADLSYSDIKQREELREYMNGLYKHTGFHPRDEKETVDEYIQRTRNYIDEREVLKADLRHTPEAIPNTASWPPADGRSGADRIHFNPYSDAVRQGAEVNVIKTSDNIRLGGDRAVVNHITGIFGEKKTQFSVPADLDKISAWKEVSGQLAGDVINGKLNKPSGWFSWLSGHKKQEQYDNLRKYLEDLKGKHNVNPVNKETVGDYVKRAEEWLSRNRAGEGDYNPNIELK